MTGYRERWQGMLFALVATDGVGKLGNHHLLLNGAEKGMSCIYIGWGAHQFIYEVRLASSWNAIWEITGSVLPNGCKAMKALMRDKGRRIWSEEHKFQIKHKEKKKLKEGL